MIVLDTCAILWDALEPGKLSPKAKKAIEKADLEQTLLISDISLWEIAMLIKRKRIEVGVSTVDLLRLLQCARHYTALGQTAEIAELAVNLDERVNGDPADRIIVATALTHRAPLVSADRNLRHCGSLEVIW